MPLRGEGQQCTAKSIRSGKQCTKWAMQGKTVCHKHGGKSKSGSQSPSLKHGRYSKHLPKNLMSIYHEALKDNEHLVQAEEVALLESMIKERWNRKKDGAPISGSMSKELVKLWNESERLKRLGLYEEGSHVLAKIGDLIKAAATDARIDDEITNLIMKKRQLIESERRRKVENKQVMAIEEVITLTTALTDAFTRHLNTLPDDMKDEIIGLVSNDITRIIHARSPVRPLQPSAN